jgi:WD40 repeat protein
LISSLTCTSLLIKLTQYDSQAVAFLQDALRFLMRHYHTLSHWPLQVYTSAIIFSPELSLVKRENLDKIPAWLGRAPPMEDSWTPMIQALVGHEETVRIITFSRDGKQIASGSADGVVKLWDAVTGSLQQTLEAHPMKITALAFLPDGKAILSGGYDGSVKRWDTTTGERQDWFHLEGPDNRDDGGTASPHALALSADCRRIAATGYRDDDDEYIMLFDAATGELQWVLADRTYGPLALAFSPDGTQLVSSYHDGAVRLWDATTGALQQTLVGHRDSVWNVAYSPDGKQIVSASHQTINVWNAATADLPTTLAYPGARAVAFSPDGQQIAACFKIAWSFGMQQAIAKRR